MALTNTFTMNRPGNELNPKKFVVNQDSVSQFRS